MADLMSMSTSYSVLEVQYGNFKVPAMKIKVSGLDIIKNMGLLVAEMEVTLSLRSAGMAVIKFAGLYDLKSHSFQSDVKTKLKPGTIVEIELGYLSSTQNVFKGYVAMVGAEIGEVPLFVVTVLDARRLMMTSGRKQVLHDVANYSDAVKTVLGEYSKLCSPVIDATSDSLEYPVSQTTNDYDFIMKELIGSGRTDREFFIVADKAYFRKPQSAKTSMMKVRYGRELTWLKVDFSYLNLKVEVIGYNPKEQEAVKSSATAKGFLSQSILQGTPPVLTVPDADADSSEKTSIRAQALARKKEESSCAGSGTVIGLPEIVPGRFLEVEALDSMLDNKYYITEVTHVINGENFMTHFQIGGVS